ncbi:hypothetical protein ABZP36_011635 [Zizania latifolia]
MGPGGRWRPGGGTEKGRADGRQVTLAVAGWGSWPLAADGLARPRPGGRSWSMAAAGRALAPGGGRLVQPGASARRAAAGLGGRSEGRRERPPASKRWRRG